MKDVKRYGYQLMMMLIGRQCILIINVVECADCIYGGFSCISPLIKHYVLYIVYYMFILDG